MQFLFHSVVELDGQTRYYNIYKIDKTHFFAECHHFNRERVCEGDFQLERAGEDWKPAQPQFEEEAKIIGEEIERLSPEDPIA